MHNLIPKPAMLTHSAGEFALSATTRINASNAEALTIGKLLAEYIEQHTNLKLTVVETDDRSGNIQLKLSADTSLGEEGYKLSIQSDGIELSASQPAGLFYGTQTLRQIISAHQSTMKLPAVSITDSPRFTWRGTMLDVARHFFCIEDIKHYIDLISMRQP